MAEFLWIKAVLKVLVLPPTGPLLVAGAGIGLCARHPRLGRALAITGVAALLALSTPVVSDLLGEIVDTGTPFDIESARRAQAVVILGGGIRRDAPEYGGDTLAALTLERVRYGARVARLTGLPVLVSGGSVSGGESEAKLMAAALEGEFGVPVRWVEADSRTTHENAARSAALMRRERIDRIVLVTHGFDTRRAAAEFSDQGLEVIAAPTGRRGAAKRTIFDYLPSLAGLHRGHHASYELLALLVRGVAAGR